MQQSQNTYPNSAQKSNGVSEQLSNFNTDFDLGLFLYVLKKNILWVILVVGISLLGSFLYLRYTSPIYQSDAIIQIEKSNKANQLLNVDDYYETGDISGEIELLKSNLIAKNAIQRLPFEVSYFNKGQFLDFELYRSAPFRLEIFSKDSSLNSTKVNITFLNRQEGVISWGPEENKTSKPIRIGEYIKLPFATLKITITNYNTIEENINSVNPTGYYFVINNLNSLSRELMSKVSILILNPSAKTVLIGKDDLTSCIYKSDQEGLEFITAGPVPPNPSELIISGKLDEIINTLKQSYDLVLSLIHI